MARFLKNFTIKQKVIVGVIIVLVLGLTNTNILYLNRIAKNFETEIISKARSICIMGEAMREYMSDNWGRGIYDRDTLKKDVKNKFVYTVPVFSSIEAMKSKSSEMGFMFRVPKFNPRNPENEPTREEARVLEKMAKESLSEYSFFDYDKREVRYFRSIALTKDCLMCHGNPALSKELWGRNDGTDPTGGKMENWKEGEAHGAFELIYPIAQHIQSKKTTMWLTMIINMLILLASVILIRMIVKKALDPLDSIALALGEINEGAGDLSRKLDIARNDEVGRVAELFNTFLDKMRGIIMSIRESADHVGTSSNEMTTSSQSLANVAQDQAASIEETSSAMEEIKATIDSVSENARQQAKKAEATTSSMEYLAAAIEKINQNAQNANRMAEETHDYAKDGETVLVSTVDSMKEINESSNKITEIVTIISDISDQINLLSLNASIEAARAGEHGRGFAVVAEEISKLADQTAMSSKEINKLILETNDKVDAGSNLVQQTAASLRKIIDNVKATASLMDNTAKSAVDLTTMSKSVQDDVTSVNRMSEEISVMMEEQSISSNEILNAINQINNVTQSVSSGSEELAAASEELLSQADLLRDIVKQFKLEE